jgi:hypothetical protein
MAVAGGEPDMREEKWGVFLIPLLSLLYVGYMVLEQYLGSYRASTVNYATGLGLVIAVLALSIIFGEIRKGSAASTDAGPEQQQDAPLGHLFTAKSMGFLLLTAMFILLVEALGYILAFFPYLAVILWMLGFRPRYMILVVAAAITAFVHLFFVWGAGLQLPKGVLHAII